MKTFLTWVAFIGLFMVFFGTLPILAYTITGFLTSEAYYVMIFGFLAILGACLASIGAFLTLFGFISKPYDYWNVFIITGFWFELPFITSFFRPFTSHIDELIKNNFEYDLFRDGLFSLLYILPGVICITLGIVLRYLDYRKKLQPH